MRFQYLCLVPFLYSLASSLALPLSSSSEISSHESRNLEDGADLPPRNSFDIEEREPSNGLAIRDFLGSLIPRDNRAYRVKKPVVKKTAAQAQQRKENVRQTVKKNQAANKIKKAELHLQAPPKEKPYGKPRPSKKPKDIDPKVGSYRARGRKLQPGAQGYRLPKQPKTPKPNAAKGSEKSLKAKATQNKALAQRKAHLSRERNKLNVAAAGHKATVGLPLRKAKFHHDSSGVTHTGKDVRTANFNSIFFKNHPVNKTPKEFKNRHQGPENAKTRPLADKGELRVGHEFPVKAGVRGGYQGGDKGPVRLVTEDHTENGATVRKFIGVVGHDMTRKKGDPGYNDHFQIHPQKS